MRHNLSAVAGRALRGVFAAMLAVRRPRPIHPHGVELHGEASWLAQAPSGIHSGVRWVDDPPPGPQRVVARASRSLGTPAPLPDVIGLALRFQTTDALDGEADLELASTGVGVPGRFALLLHGPPSRAHLGSLLPYVGDRGPVLIAARTIGPSDLPSAPAALAERLRHESWRLRLYVATPLGRWHPFAELVLRAGPGPVDTPTRFDAGRRLLPGARMPAWVRAVRQPSYDRVQRGV